MVSLSKDPTFPEYAGLIREIYGAPNDRYYTHWDMIVQIQRFTMRAIKGIRKENPEKTVFNATIALSWFTSLMNRLYIKVDDVVWERFPYLCSYCGEAPCACKAEKVETRRKVVADSSARPKTMKEFQIMFDKIYPAQSRTSKDAVIHLAEETGEFSEAMQAYMSDRSDSRLKNVQYEAADFISCMLGVFNSLNIDLADRLAKKYYNNCEVCHNAPCTCSYESIVNYRS